jgi:branched-subunit amino acid permease
VTLPVVVALHPIAIALLMIAPLRHRVAPAAVLMTVAIALIFGCFDAAHILGSMPETWDVWFTQYVPLYHYYAGWIVPTIVMLVAGLVVTRIIKQPVAAVVNA